MNKALNPYVNDIIAIAGANHMEWDEGVDMFLANVKARENKYPGADHLDWDVVANEIGPITPAEEADMRKTYCEDYRARMSEVIALRRTGRYGEAVEVMLR